MEIIHLERTQFSKSRSNDLKNIGQGQRSSHVTHLLMLVIICTKYGKNSSRTVGATGTRFSRSRPNDLENIGQGQRSLHATHPLMLMMICAKYGRNASRIVDFFFKVKAEKLKKNAKKWIFLNFVMNLARNTPSNGSGYSSSASILSSWNAIGKFSTKQNFQGHQWQRTKYMYDSAHVDKANSCQ